MLTLLYIKKHCLYSLSTRIAMEEKNITFKVVNLVEKQEKKLIFQNLHYPILQEKNNIISNQEVLILYIDERYPHPPLLPSYSNEKIKIRLAIRKISREWCKLLMCIITEQNIMKVKQAKIILLNQLYTIDASLKHHIFFMSDNITLADCFLGAFLYQLTEIDFKFIESLEELQKYKKRLFARTSFQKTFFDYQHKMSFSVYDK